MLVLHRMGSSLLSRLVPLAATLVSLAGCEELSESLTKHWYMDHGYRDRLRAPLWQRYEQKMYKDDPPPPPRLVSPPHLDQG